MSPNSVGLPVVIVMIEDDEGHATLIERNIRRAGVNNQIFPFTNGTAALDFLLGEDGSGSAHAGNSLLILLDLNLPDMTGVDILGKIKGNQHLKRSPVVVLTTTDDQREIKRCYDLGANVYITKPVNYEGFANAIQQLGLFLSVVAVPSTKRSHGFTMAGVRVLYIDDDPGIGRLVERALASRGIAVQHVVDGDAGVALLAREPFDAIALDHNLASETGLEVIPRLRRVAADTPVIYVTGSEDARVAVAALKAGAADYVWKDVQGHFRELLGQATHSALTQQRLKHEA